MVEQNPGVMKPEDVFRRSHINQAVYLARMIGLDVVGFAVDETK